MVIGDVAAQALEVEHALLTGVRCPPASFADARDAGMYAWWDEHGALEQAWPAAFPHIDVRRPIYVGKAMKSLAKRGVEMHLKKTRMSSLRRSLASLLADELDLLPGARAHAKRKFSLEDAAEERLSGWMEEHLTVVTVARPAPDLIECAVIASTLPPLNDRCAHHGPYWRAMDGQRAALHARIAIG
jgi:hypothetical protein